MVSRHEIGMLTLRSSTKKTLVIVKSLFEAQHALDAWNLLTTSHLLVCCSSGGRVYGGYEAKCPAADGRA